MSPKGKQEVIVVQGIMFAASESASFNFANLTLQRGVFWLSATFFTSLTDLTTVKLETSTTWDVVFAVSFYHSKVLYQEMGVIHGGFQLADGT
jgi:hypothetical protein